MIKRLQCALVLLLLSCAWVEAAPYKFSPQLDDYTWGEGLAKAKEELGQPYSQDPGGVTYLLDGNWIKQILTYNGQVYQIIERIIYAQEDPAAGKEYAALKQKLVEFYGPPAEEDVACPNPQPQIKCRITRWDRHPQTQVFLAHSQEQAQSIMLGVTSKEIRRQALSTPQSRQPLSVGQLIGAFQQDPAGAAHKYGGQKIQVMGMSGGMFKDDDGQLRLRVYNAFKPEQQLICRLAAGIQVGLWLPPEGSLVISGRVGEYQDGVVQMLDCEVSAPAEK